MLLYIETSTLPHNSPGLTEAEAAVVRDAAHLDRMTVAEMVDLMRRLLATSVTAEIHNVVNLASETRR